MLKNLLLYLTPPSNPDRKLSEYFFSFVKKYEGPGPIKEINGERRCMPYICPAGVPTIGYGRTIDFNTYHSLKEKGISLKQAEINLREDSNRFAKEVAKLIKVPVQDWQFDSIVSLAYNIGLGNLKKSTLLRKLNAKDYAGAANEFTKWVYGGGKKLPGLVNRRKAEKKMFLNNPPRPVVVGNNVHSILARKEYMNLLVANE